jgi:hypothetical protein
MIKFILSIIITLKLQVMVVIKAKKVSELLKKEILKNEKKKSYFSDRFKKIEDKINLELDNRNADEALKHMTI